MARLTDFSVPEAFLVIRDYCLKSDDESLKPLGKLSLIPRFVTDRAAQAAPEHGTA